MKSNLNYFKWTVADAKVLKDLVDNGQLTLADVGELFLAVMDYVGGEEVTVSPKLLCTYVFFKQRVDDSRLKMIKTKELNRKNGGKWRKVPDVSERSEAKQ